MEANVHNSFKRRVVEFLLKNSNNKKIIIALTGKKRSGKTYHGQYLVEKHGFTKLAFADKLKELLKEHFNIELIKPEDIDSLERLNKIKIISKTHSTVDVKKRLIDALSELFDPAIAFNFCNTERADKFIKMIKNIDNTNDLRHIYQYFGSEICRYIDDEIWIKAYDKQIQRIDNNLIVTDDVRFYNEYKCIEKYPHLFVYINNNYVLKDEHISENVEHLKTFADIIINNNYKRSNNYQKVSL